MASDACESRGLEVAKLSEDTQSALRGLLAPEASVRNPVDMIASASATAYERSLRVLLDAPEVDMVLVLFVTPIVTDAGDVASAILRGAAGSSKTVATCFMGRRGVPEAVRSLREGRFPSYAFPESAAAALARAARYGQWLATPEGVIPEFTDIDLGRARAVIEQTSGSRWLTPSEVRSVLESFGVRTPREAVCTTAEEAAREAEKMGAPVALKLVSETITHKSDVGGVALNLRGGDAVRAAWNGIEARLDAAGLRSQMQGALVQEMAPSGVETFVGATRDPEFGPLIGFGLGGVQVELWKDVAFRVAPLRDRDAADMLAQIRARALLDGFRGSAPVDRGALTDVILRVSRLIEELPQVVEVDLNPVVALPHGTVVVDARIRVST